MPLTKLLEHLAQAKENVAAGERNIARQRDIIAELERDGHDVTEAKKLLARFEETQALQIAGLETIKSELATGLRGET